MSDRNLTWSTVFRAAFLPAVLTGVSAFGGSSAPTLETIYPTGAAAGSTVKVELSGAALTGLRGLHSSIPGFQSVVKDANHAEIMIPAETPPGLYDVWVFCENGVSSPRTFVVSHRQEVLESTANETPSTAAPVPLNCVLNGRLEQPGDLDHFCFDAQRGQRVILECWAERIDSRLRAILEVFDSNGRRLAVNRGNSGIDPLIDFRAPADGTYIVKVADLVFSGSPEHYYRLDIDAGPRVAFTVPNVISRGQAGRVRLFGWNLTPRTASASIAATGQPAVTRLSNGDAGDLDQIEVEIPAALAQDTWPLPVRLASNQLAGAGFPYHYPGSQAAVIIGLTDVPVQLDQHGNHTPASAQTISVPCEVSGRLVAGDERDWFAIEVQRGEVLHIDVLSQRLGAPTDLQLSLWNSAGEVLLAEWNDEQKNSGGLSFPTSHLDPSGRWVSPANGRFLLLIRNLSGGQKADPRRNYRLSVRREEPDFQLVAVPRSTAPVGFNVRTGGRFAFDVLAFRQRGLNDAIRVSAIGLPTGVECSEIVLGPGVDRGTMVVSAESSLAEQLLSLKLEGHADAVGRRPVRGSAVVRSGKPNGWSRLTSEIPLVVNGEAPVRITAIVQDALDHHLYGKLRLRYSPGSVLDVAVSMEQRQPQHQPAVKLMGVGLPSAISQQTAVIPAGQRSGTISFFLPPTLATGQYSLAVAGETTVPAADGKTETVTVISNPVTISVEPAAFRVDIDPFTPQRVKRGETFEVKYSAERTNGFIGKIHTELASPGVVTNVVGLRGRGVTFVGQSDQGSIQIVVNDDAPFGAYPFLRLFGVGVLEDQPTYFGAALFPLEIVQ